MRIQNVAKTNKYVLTNQFELSAHFPFATISDIRFKQTITIR